MRSLAIGLVLFCASARLFAADIVLPRGRVVESAAPLTPLEFQGIVSSQLTQFLRAEPGAGLLQLKALAELPAGPEQASARAILSLMAGAAAQSGLAQKVGGDNSAAIAAAASHLDGLAAKNVRLSRMMAGLRGQFAAGDAEDALERLFEGAGLKKSKEGLSPEAVNALHLAAQDDYTVSVLRKEVGGGQRLVVLLGEAHIKNDKSAALGKEVLKHFKHRGIEGYDSRSTWAGRLAMWGLSRVRQDVQKNSDRKNESTIHQALYEEDIMSAVVDLVACAGEKRRGELRAWVEGSSDGALDESRVIEGLGGTFRLRYLKQALANFDDNAKARLDAADAQPILHRLERGHRPDLAERISIAYLAGKSIAFPLFILASLVMSGVNLLLTLATSHYLALLIAEGVAVAAVACCWAFIYYPLIFKNGLITARDKTMAGNLAKVIDDNLGGDSVLAIVGKAHVPGMKKLLGEKYGFTEIPMFAATAPVRALGALKSIPTADLGSSYAPAPGPFFNHAYAAAAAWAGAGRKAYFHEARVSVPGQEGASWVFSFYLADAAAKPGASVEKMDLTFRRGETAYQMQGALGEVVLAPDTLLFPMSPYFFSRGVLVSAEDALAQANRLADVLGPRAELVLRLHEDEDKDLWYHSSNKQVRVLANARTGEVRRAG